jgi:hypothetical protein
MEVASPSSGAAVVSCNGVVAVSASSHLVAAMVVGELRETGQFAEWRKVHVETASVAVSQSIPSADGIVRGSPPRLDGAWCGILFLVTRAELDPVALCARPRVPVGSPGRRSGASWIRPGRRGPLARRRRRGTSCRRTSLVACSTSTGRPLFASLGVLDIAGSQASMSSPLR